MKFAIIEIGSNNTKTHVYEDGKVVFDNNVTIELKKNYKINNKICESDLNKLYNVIEEALKHTKEVHIFGCSIFRNISDAELQAINNLLKEKYNLSIEVVSQKEEALLTAYGCYNDHDFDKNMCIFIGGGGSTELVFVNNKQIIDQKYFDFGVVDITSKFPSLKDDYNVCTFDEVYSYIDTLIGDINIDCDVLILSGGDHLYWYNNAEYKLNDNTLYDSPNQKYIITREMNDQYDRDALQTSLDRIRANSDNPLWFDGSRAMKVITNVISHKINAKYIVPTKINMEDGIAHKIMNDQSN